MTSHQCAVKSATALSRVFINSSLNASDDLHLTRIFVPSLLPYPQQQTRTYTSFLGSMLSFKPGSWGSTSTTQGTSSRESGSTQRPRKYVEAPRPLYNLDTLSSNARGTRPPPPPPRTKVKLARLPRDDEIRDRWVILSDSVDGDEHLSVPQPLQSVLASVHRKTHSLQVIRAPDPNDSQAPKYPICRIINKKEELDRLRKAKEQKKRGAAPKEKTLEINWGMAEHDLDNKIRKLREFLAKGYRVEVLLAPKSRSKVTPTVEIAESVLQKVLDVTREVKGSKEWSRRDGNLLGSMRVFLQGKVQ